MKAKTNDTLETADRARAWQKCNFISNKWNSSVEWSDDDRTIIWWASPSECQHQTHWNEFSVDLFSFKPIWRRFANRREPLRFITTHSNTTRKFQQQVESAKLLNFIIVSQTDVPNEIAESPEKYFELLHFTHNHIEIPSWIDIRPLLPFSFSPSVCVGSEPSLLFAFNFNEN